jgi:hypothetical protein
MDVIPFYRLQGKKGLIRALSKENGVFPNQKKTAIRTKKAAKKGKAIGNCSQTKRISIAQN